MMSTLEVLETCRELE